MGSRVMHSIINNEIASRMKIEDKAAFLLGGIAPDAVSPKDLSHFYKGNTDEYTRRIDYKSFLNKYRSKSHSPYILGYYTHLISDHVWLTGFYLPWLKNRMEKDEEVFTRYHNDFRLSNAKLSEHYGQVRFEMKNVNVPNLDEVSADQVSAFIPYVLKDFEYDKRDAEKPLEMFTFQQIIGYVETSVELGAAELKKLSIVKN
ncbi:zinc dependent phospholipase C family protein [Cytobacillus firmus]|uniref:zinc dependent phospholipase C family protein n=1 Tax=Cytobacillus firmus TaxID=1399 RepID=UPI0038500F52